MGSLTDCFGLQHGIGKAEKMLPGQCRVADNSLMVLEDFSVWTKRPQKVGP